MFASLFWEGIWQVYVKQNAHSGDLILGISHPKWRVVPADPRATAADPAQSKNDAMSLPSVASVMHLPCYHWFCSEEAACQPVLQGLLWLSCFLRSLRQLILCSWEEKNSNLSVRPPKKGCEEHFTTTVAVWRDVHVWLQLLVFLFFCKAEGRKEEECNLKCF